MICSLVDLVRHIERKGAPHIVRAEQGCIELAVDRGTLIVWWEEARGRVFVTRSDDDDSRAALRLSMPLGLDGSISEAALERLLAGVA